MPPAALFAERGYQATTIDAISDRADVPPATVYRLFSSKLGILKAMLDVSIAGDDQPLSLPERPGGRPRSPPSPTRRSCSPGSPASPWPSTRGAATSTASSSSAAGSDPAAAELFADYQQQRTHGQGQIARALARAGALRPGLRGTDAADLIHALMSPELYRLLVIDRGWSPERYERWLAATLADQLTSPERTPRA